MTAAILVLSCGGTFDKSKFTRTGKFVCGTPQALELLAQAGVEPQQYTVLSLLRKDSLDMDDADRALVVATVQQATAPRIVIVHGTDTLVTTAQALHETAPTKTIVLVGAMRPAVFSGSDAAFNLGFALGIATTQPAGVWVAMHGRLWPADGVRKDADGLRFVSA